MKRLLLACLLLSGIGLAQTWIPSLSAPFTTYNNVQISDLTHPDPPNTTRDYGPALVLSAVASGGVVTYTTNKGMTYVALGHTICISVGQPGPGCASTSTILTPGNNIAPDLLGTCVITVYDRTVSPTTFGCASASTGSWTLTQPYTDQNASTVSYNNQMWQVYSQASDAIGGPSGPPRIPGKLYVRTSSTTPNTFPPLWNTPFNLDVTLIPNCPHGTPPQIDVRIPLIGLMPNGDMAVWIDAECYPFSSTIWFMHHDHTQAYTAGWTGPTQITEIPPGWASISWGCFQDAGEMNYDPIDGMPIFTLGGALGGSTCVNSIPFLFKTTDNGVSWSLVKQIFNGLSIPTFEFTMVNPSGVTWIAFLRMLGNSAKGTFAPPYYSISTDNMDTWTPWTSTQLPVSNACSRWNQAPTNGYIVSPVSRCGNPAPGLCVLFYADRIACTAAAITSEMALEYDPALLLANGAAYMSTLRPTSLYDGIVSSGLDGYQYVVFPTPSTFHTWWHGINTYTVINPLNIFEAHGQFSDITSTITIHGGGSYSGQVVSSDGRIICNIVQGTASGGVCSEVIINGTSITLTAYVGRGSSFGGFSGWCGGTGSPSTCVVNTNQTVTATFNVLVPNVFMGGTQRQGGTVIAQ